MKTIYEIIKDEIIEKRGYNCFLSRKYIIRNKLNILQPDKPEDGTCGFLAYNVPGKERMKMKTGRFLSRKLSLNSGFLNDRSIQDLANNINSELFPNIDIQIVNGRDITQAYENAIGSTSCMTGTHSDYTLLYENNPDRFEMLIMRYLNDDARAIVHTFDNGQKMMDRVYASSGMLKDRMKAHAWNQGWFNGYGTDEEDENWIISDLNWADGEVPYMDTMVYYKIQSNGKMTISASSCLNYDGELQSTDGSVENRYHCENCDSNISEDECIYTDDGCYCESCHSDLFSQCEKCGEYVFNEDIISVDNGNSCYCQHCIDRGQVDVFYCEDCNEYFSDVVCIEDERWVCGSCSESTSYDICKGCGQYFYNENLTEVDGLWYCKDCEPDDPVEQITCKDYPGQLEMQYNG